MSGSLSKTRTKLALCGHRLCFLRGLRASSLDWPSSSAEPSSAPGGAVSFSLTARESEQSSKFRSLQQPAEFAGV